MEKRKLIVITGPAGSGKTSIRDYVIEKYNAGKVITHTTRKPRCNEKNGIDYYFETEESFRKLHLLEHVEYSNAHYGSSLEGVKAAWRNSSIAVIVLDTLGAATYKKQLGDCVDVWFIQVSNPKILQRRMIARGDEIQKVEQRISSNEYKRDMQIPAELKGFAIVIENNDWHKAQQQVDKIIKKRPNIC